MNAFRIDARIAAMALVALALAGAAPQWAAAQGGAQGNCRLWSKMEASVTAGDLKAAGAVAAEIEDEPHCNHLAADAKKAVVDAYRAVDARMERQKVAPKDRVKHLQERLKLLQEALNNWNAWDIHAKIAELEAKLPGKKDHAKISMALDRALVALDELPASELPPKEQIARMMWRAYGHEALAAAQGVPVQREAPFRNIATRQINVDFVPAPLQFKYNEAELTLAGEAQAKLVLKHLQDRKMPPLKIIGHTDPDGTFEYNDELSIRRAATIKKFLEDNGYPRGRITIAGRGKRDAPAFEKLIENRASLTRDEIHQILRRVELKFVQP